MAAFVVIGGCREITIQSGWENRMVAIDGAGADWENTLTYLEDMNTAVGFRNGADSFSMCFVPWNRKTQVTVAEKGCVVWFMSTANVGNRFGVHYPVGDVGVAKNLAENLSKTDAVNLIHQLASREKNIELVDDHRKVIGRLTNDEAREQGIQIALGDYNGRMMIEARMPFVFEVGGQKYDIRASQSIVEMQIETVLTDRRGKEKTENAMIPPVGLTENSRIHTDSQSTDTEKQTNKEFINQLEFSLTIRLADNLQPDNGSGSE